MSDAGLAAIASGKTTVQAAEAAGMSISFVWTRLRRMEAAGLMRSTGRAKRGNPVRWSAVNAPASPGVAP
jgi:molybdenum-dependent DNA-binding transcriptional regulator ModE